MNAFILTVPNLNPHDRPTILHTLDWMASRCVMTEANGVLTVAGHTILGRDEFIFMFGNETAIPRNEWTVQAAPLS